MQRLNLTPRALCLTRLLSMAAALLLLLTPLALSAAGKVSVKAELDSVTLLMGHRNALNVTLVKPAALRGRLAIPADSLAAGVEIAAEGPADTADVGSGVQEIKRRIIIQAFDSGLYVLRPIPFVGPDGDTLARSNSPILKVYPVNVDSLTTIHDYADAQDVNRRLLDYLPDFLTEWGLWVFVGLVVLIAAAWVYFRYIRKGKISLRPAPKPVPPYEMAVSQLNELRSRHLCEQGLEKEYYTRLTDILRIYLDRRFGINAMEMTTSQISDALEHNEHTSLSGRLMKEVLRVADFVKFAAQRPLPDDNVKAFTSAMQFVEDTKPQPDPEQQPQQQQQQPQQPSAPGRP